MVSKPPEDESGLPTLIRHRKKVADARVKTSPRPAPTAAERAVESRTMLTQAISLLLFSISSLRQQQTTHAEREESKPFVVRDQGCEVN